MPIPMLRAPTRPAPAELPRQVRRSDPERRAFEALYRQHYTTIAAYLYRRTASVHLAEDLAAETFLAAFRSIDRLAKEHVDPKFWLLRVATNAVSRRARDDQRRARREQARPPVPSPPPADWTPEQLAVRAAVAKLPPRLQDVISLHYFAGLNVAEVARVLSCREGTVKSRLARSRDRLRALLSSTGGAK